MKRTTSNRPSSAADRAKGAAAPQLSRYEQVKAHIRARVADGTWQPGDRIPSELALVDTLGVSRMTVNRAVRELADEGLLTRVPTVGTFVAEPKPQSTLLMIAHIRDEIRGRGHEHSYTIQRAERVMAPAAVSSGLGLPPGAPVFHLVCVHRENGLPVQLEDRYVNPAMAPHFLEQDYATVLPSEYLMTTGPLHKVEHIVDAGMPSAQEAALLEIAPSEPCLILHRRTWTHGTLVTFARFTYPASRYRLGCVVAPEYFSQQR
ncbi:histidine utilization repressor [Pandoraea terrae]|uniref:Histidine utilization repressor n=1 Tax=Pandoraea terrae TaxID=1537710 RepID=A0A5E4TJ94_9BURK|nr:histidine utilization repressor [Pandoraea terrae]VVD87935.1 histidine utilization repressor [Pandoraea terrae]